VAKQLFGWGLGVMVAGVLAASYFCARVGVVGVSPSFPLHSGADKAWAHCFIAMAVIGGIAWLAGMVMLLSQGTGDLGGGLPPSREA